MDHVLAHRTRHLCLVLEDLHQSQNASAALRSCECFGVQDVHVIERLNRFQVNKTVSLGASKWLSLHRCRLDDGETSQPYLESIRDQGYQLAALTLRPGSRPIQEVDITRPTALLFGNEENGLSDAAHLVSDLHVHLPMVGFTQSFNVSVSVALCLQDMTARMREAEVDQGLSLEQCERLRLHWILNTISNPEIQVREFLGSRGGPPRDQASS
jgi:tRNA (guanosine-2'-O-)-methyltransferase